MRTKNNPYKLDTGSNQQIGRVSPKKSPRKTSMQNSTKADKTNRENGSPRKTRTPDRQQLYSCGICNDTYTGSALFLRHQKEVHKNGPLYTCYQCDGIYVGSEPLIRHQKEAHKDGPLFVLPQKVVDAMGTKDVKQIVEAYGDRLTILDADGCHGRVILSVDVEDVDVNLSGVNMLVDHDTYTKVLQTNSGGLRQKIKRKNRMDLGSAITNATALERAVEVLKKDVKSRTKQKTRTMKMASKHRNTKDGRVPFVHSQIKDAVSINGTKVKRKTVAGKPLKKQHVLKVKLRMQAAAGKKKKSQNRKKYVCWGCGVSYDEQTQFAEHQATCKTRSLCQFEVLQGRSAKSILEKTIIGTITEKEEPRAPLSALIRCRKLPGLSCVFCGEWYMYTFQLERHKKVCKQMGADTHNFKCSGCMQAFSLRYDQCMHILNHCPSVLDGVSASNTFVLSKLRSIQEQTEKERMESSNTETSDGAHSPTASTLFCYDCASHIDLKQFRDHKLECGAKPPVAMTCLDCCERFPSRLEMNEHKRRHHTYRHRVPVCTCGVVFKKNSDFLQHRKDNPSHCLSPVDGPTQTASTPGSSSSACQGILDVAERMNNSVDKVDASSPEADVASFVTSVPSEKGKLCRVQVHTSAEGNAITNVTVQFQGRSLDIGVPGVDAGTSATTPHTPAPAPTGRSVVEGRQSTETRQSVETRQPRQPKKEKTCSTAPSTLPSSDTNPLTALGLVRRSSLLNIHSKANTPTSGTKTVQSGLDATTRTKPLPDDKPSTSTLHLPKPKRVNHGPVIKKVMLPGMKIGYLVPVSKTTNQQAAVAEAKTLLQKVKPPRNNAAATRVSEGNKLLSSDDTSAAPASLHNKSASPACTTTPPEAAAKTTTVQKQIPQTRSPAVHAPGTLESQVETAKTHSARMTSTQESRSQKPEQPESELRPQSSTVTSSPRKKPPKTSNDKSESPANAAQKVEQAVERSPVEPVLVQTKPAPQKPALRKLPSAATEKAKPTEKARQAPKRKQNAERDDLDDSTNEPSAKRLRTTVSTSRSGGGDRRRDDEAVNKAATAVVTPSGLGRAEENGVTSVRSTRAGMARDVTTAKRPAVDRSQQISPTPQKKSARSLPPSPTKEVKSQPTARNKTTPQLAKSSSPPTKDITSDTRAGVRRSEAASSQSSAPKPGMAHRPCGLMLIVPVNTDTVRCIRCEMKFTRVRDITAHECDGRPVSVIVQAELKIGDHGAFTRRGNGAVNGGEVKVEPETDGGQ